MKVKFYKYQGAGNDFILIDNRQNIVNHHNPGLISHLCDRRFGIGGDGMMFLQDTPVMILRWYITTPTASPVVCAATGAGVLWPLPSSWG